MLQEQLASTNDEINRLQQHYLELQNHLKSLKQLSLSGVSAGSTPSLSSAVDSLEVNNYYYFFYSNSTNTIVIDMIKSYIKKGSNYYSRMESIYTRQTRNNKLPDGIYPKVQTPSPSLLITVVFQNRSFSVKITSKMSGAQLYTVVKYSLLADGLISENDTIILQYNLEVISFDVILMSLNMTEASVIQAYRIIETQPLVDPEKPVIISLEDSAMQDNFIWELSVNKYQDVKHLVLLAGPFQSLL